MIVSVNMSQEVYDYFKDYDFSDVANSLLEQYDFTCLPPTSGIRDKEVRVNIVNPTYIQLYNIVGPRSKKVSLGRLFEFARNIDALSDLEIEPRDKTDSPVPALLEKVYRTLLEIQKYTDDSNIKEITDIIRSMK